MVGIVFDCAKEVGRSSSIQVLENIFVRGCYADVIIVVLILVYIVGISEDVLIEQKGVLI